MFTPGENAILLRGNKELPVEIVSISCSKSFYLLKLFRGYTTCSHSELKKASNGVGNWDTIEHIWSPNKGK